MRDDQDNVAGDPTRGREEERLRHALEAAVEGVWDWDLETGEITVTDHFTTLLGYDPDQMPASFELWTELMHPDDAPASLKTVQEFLDSCPELLSLDFRVRRADGGWQWIRCRGRCVERDEDGRARRAIGSLVDIADQKRVEEALRLSEERYRLLVESQGEGIGIVDGQECFTFVNPAAEKIFGLEPGTMLGRSLRDFVDQAQFQAILEQTGTRRSGESSTYEIDFTRADGQKRTMLVTATPRMGQDGEYDGAFGIFHDITDRKRMEAELREGEERYRELIESLPHGVGIVQDRRIEYANNVAIRMLGYESLDEIRDVAVLEPLVESERERVRALVIGMLQQTVEGPVHYQTTARRPDGSDVPLDVHVSLVRYRGRPALQVFMMDLSDRQMLEDQLLQAQKMESVGRMAGGLAHDFNNILSPIIMLADMAVMEMSPGEPRHADFEQIRIAAMRAKDLTQQLLAFGRKQMLTVRVLDLNQVVTESHDMLRRLIREDVEIELDLQPSLPSVRADPTQLQQVLLNLAINARDAMPDGGRLRLATFRATAQQMQTLGVEEADQQDHVCLLVGDTGRGMNAETRSHIFEPFFSTKEQGRGTGLGLSMVHGIVSQHGGRITVQSEPGRGATFRIYLPGVDEEARSVSLPATVPPRSHEGETVLLAEDDEMVRRQVRRILERFGLNVIEAGDGSEALELAGRHRGPIHLLLSDVIMPRMNGRQLHLRLRETFPDLEAVFMSGYADEVIGKHGVLEKGTRFVQKPYTVETLMREVRAALDAVRSTG